jgi:hypothetical protein
MSLCLRRLCMLSFPHLLFFECLSVDLFVIYLLIYLLIVVFSFVCLLLIYFLIVFELFSTVAFHQFMSLSCSRVAIDVPSPGGLQVARRRQSRATRGSSRAVACH